MEVPRLWAVLRAGCASVLGVPSAIGGRFWNASGGNVGAITHRLGLREVWLHPLSVRHPSARLMTTTPPERRPRG